MGRIICSFDCLLWGALIAGLQCGFDNLPPFRDFRGDSETPSGIPEHDRFQAIVPAYTFQCSGRVTEWGACVQPGGGPEQDYYIQFQVWRPTDISGCYSRVGFNSPVDEDGNDGFLDPPDNNLRRCVVLLVPEDQQIEVQSGDVVGYYVDHFRDGLDRENSGGIQWIEADTDKKRSTRDSEDANVVVHYRDELPREDIKSYYALGSASSCGFPMSDDSINSYSLTTSISAAPIISLTGMCVNTVILATHHCKNSTVTAVPIPTTSVTSSVIIGE